MRHTAVNGDADDDLRMISYHDRSKINLPALNLVAQKLPETEISSAQTEVAGKGSDARTALAKIGMRGAGQLPYLGKFCSKFGT